MRLNQPLVTSFTFNGVEYRLDMTFDNVLDIFDRLEDKTLRDYEKAELGLIYMLDDQEYPSNPYEQIKLWNYIYENFLSMEEEEPVLYDRKGNPVPTPNKGGDGDKKQHIDLSKDADFIFASFLQAYKINLFEQQQLMHWHEFKSLLNGLPSSTIMQKVIQIRLWKPSKHDTAKHKEEMRELQRKYALDNDREEEVD